jgi:hypothetical protein
MRMSLNPNIGRNAHSFVLQNPLPSYSLDLGFHWTTIAKTLAPQEGEHEQKWT